MSDQRRPSRAVIPAAGPGTRLLPATEAVATEPPRVADVPAMEYIVAGRPAPVVPLAVERSDPGARFRHRPADSAAGRA